MPDAPHTASSAAPDAAHDAAQQAALHAAQDTVQGATHDPPAGRGLFMRLMAVQLLTMLGLMAVLGVLFYAERNATVAQLAARAWTPALREALGAGGSGQPLALQQRASRPDDALTLPAISPRAAALRETLRRGGIAVGEIALDRSGPRPVLWLAVAPADGTPPRWFGFPDPLIESGLPWRVLGAVLAVVLLAGAASLWLIVAMNRAWRATQQRLQRHEQERALMLAGISHDLRSPLARIRLAAGLLPEDPAIAPRREAIERNVQVADRLIESFLDHARAGALPLDQAVDLVPLARRMLQGPDVALQAPAALVLPRAHPLLLERVLGNLLDNAQRHGAPPWTLRLAEQGGEAVVEVEDGGAGIPPAQREPLQRAFARGDASRGRPGTGLGLAVVRQAVERLGGRVEFESGAGRFVVRLRLPLR
jgi:two-component system, OmpR family, osmolarity sensor histidine kinase EnvZ